MHASSSICSAPSLLPAAAGVERSQPGQELPPTQGGHQELNLSQLQSARLDSKQFSNSHLSPQNL